MLNEPRASMAQIATELGWFTEKSNQPSKSRVERAIGSLKDDGLVNKRRKKWQLTGTGKKEAEAIEKADKLGLFG